MLPLGSHRSKSCYLVATSCVYMPVEGCEDFKAHTGVPQGRPWVQQGTSQKNLQLAPECTQAGPISLSTSLLMAHLIMGYV